MNVRNAGVDVRCDRTLDASLAFTAATKPLISGKAPREMR